MNTNSKAIILLLRRIIAFVIDAAILFSIGYVLSLFLSDIFSELKLWGRLIGLIIAVLYFGIFNSNILYGHTIGKLIVRIKVVDSEGKYISIIKSILRSLIYIIPYFVLFIFSQSSNVPYLLRVLENLIPFGIGGIIIYLFIFNWKTHQSLHDIIVNTYVVDLNNNVSNESKSISLFHYIFCSIYFVILLILFSLIEFNSASNSVLKELPLLEKEILKSNEFHDVRATLLQTDNEKILIIHTFPNNKIDNYKDHSKLLSLRIYKLFNEFDTMMINYNYGFNIGLYWSGSQYHMIYKISYFK